MATYFDKVCRENRNTSRNAKIVTHFLSEYILNQSGIAFDMKPLIRNMYESLLFAGE